MDRWVTLTFHIPFPASPALFSISRTGSASGVPLLAQSVEEEARKGLLRLGAHFAELTSAERLPGQLTSILPF